MYKWMSYSSHPLHTRRGFLGGTAAALTAGICGGLALEAGAADEGPKLDVLGPRPGYSPQVGTFVSMLTWMREANGVLAATKGLTQTDLDFLFDANANSIGALMLHLAATETYYGMNTFGGMKWGSWSDDIKKQWDPAMDLGDAGRKTIRGMTATTTWEFCMTCAKRRGRIQEARRCVAAERNEGHRLGACKQSLQVVHVCEHEAHHTGQIALLRKRLPGAKPDAG